MGRDLEGPQQRMVMQWMRARGIEFFGVPNEGKRTGSFAGRMKANGMRAGVPDLILITPAPDGSPVAIEMKSGAKKKFSEKQEAMAEIFKAEGWHVLLGLGAIDAIEKLEALGF